PGRVIGTNKKCAQETVDALLEDADAGHLPEPPTHDADAFEARLRERKPQLITYAGWEAIDRHEKALGEPQGRPRVKLTRLEELLRVAADEAPSQDELAQGPSATLSGREPR